MKQVPTEADWGDWQSSDLDIAYAHKIFGGKTNEEVQEDFARSVIERTDELRWMPEIPFQYYIFGFRDFVMARKFDEFDSSDAASCFLELIEEKLEHQPEYIRPVIEELMPAVRRVVDNQAEYDAAIDIYGDFKEKGNRIVELWQKLA